MSRLPRAARVALAAALAFACSLALPTRGQACGLQNRVFGGEPLDGATGVPTDVVPWVWGELLVGEVSGLYEASGERVPTDPRYTGYATSLSVFEFVPRAPLAPRTRYRFVVEPLYTRPQRVIEFTTGDGPLAGNAPEPPAVRAQIARRRPNERFSSCGDEVVTCVGSDTPVTLEIGHRDATGAFVGDAMFDGPSLADYPGLARGFLPGEPESFCFAVRSRDLAGRRSAPVDFCSNAVVNNTIARGLQAACRQEFPTGLDPAEPPTVGHPAWVCSARLPGRGTLPTGALAALGLCVVLVRSLRRSARSA